MLRCGAGDIALRDSGYYRVGLRILRFEAGDIAMWSSRCFCVWLEILQCGAGNIAVYCIVSVIFHLSKILYGSFIYNLFVIYDILQSAMIHQTSKTFLSQWRSTKCTVMQFRYKN